MIYFAVIYYSKYYVGVSEGLNKVFNIESPYTLLHIRSVSYCSEVANDVDSKSEREEIHFVKSLVKRIKNKEKLWMFRAQLLQLYRSFEAQVEALCQRTGVEINFWYSPSQIPQPKFIFDRVGLDADILYHEDEFNRFAPKIPWRNTQRSRLSRVSLSGSRVHKNRKKRARYLL
jgi:hypothetical protein